MSNVNTMMDGLVDGMVDFFLDRIMGCVSEFFVALNISDYGYLITSFLENVNIALPEI